jgi:hypothetical protein
MGHDSSEYSPSRAVGQGFGPLSGPHSCRSALIDAQWNLPGGTTRVSANRRGQTMTAQDNWRWCNKCQVLAYAGFPSLGACAAGGSHDHSGSGDYVLIQDVPVGGNEQDNWRWCNKCQALAFAGNPSPGPCADGGSHDHSGSGDYVLSFE